MSDQDFTIFVGQLHPNVDEEILYELFLQAGPLEDVRIPTANGVRRAFGFVKFKHEISVPYALYLLDGTKLFGRSIKCNSRSSYLDLFRPRPMPPVTYRGEESSSLRQGGGISRRFKDTSMIPGKKSRIRDASPPASLRGGGSSFESRLGNKSMMPLKKMDEDARDRLNSLRGGMGSHLGKRKGNDSMMPSSRSHIRFNSPSPPREVLDRWSHNSYPSQRDMSDRGHERRSRHGDAFERGSSPNRSRSHPYNEKHHNRDKNRFNSKQRHRNRHR